MKFFKSHYFIRPVFFCMSALILSPEAMGQNEQRWTVTPYLGASLLSDPTADASALTIGGNNFPAGSLDIQTDSGFYAGLGLGYTFDNQVMAELAWEYRTNDSETGLSDSATVYGGNLASSIFYANLLYPAIQHQDWTLYTGAGLGWVQEIDLDVEQGDREQSYAGDGDISYQLLLKLQYTLTSNLDFSAHARWSSLDSVTLKGEGAAVGTIENLDYNPASFGIGLTYRF